MIRMGMCQDHGGDVVRSDAFGLQVFQQIARGRCEPICSRIHEYCLLFGLDNKAGIGTDDLSQREVVIAEATFKLFLRHVREKPARWVEERPVINRGALNITDTEMFSVR